VIDKKEKPEQALPAGSRAAHNFPARFGARRLAAAFRLQT
jgi:hypothetical protein